MSSIWPILPGSQKPPQGWPGWPEGKQFALVLTHDVEGELGASKCCELAQVEKSLGFRSSFNLVPEGDYTVPSGLRAELQRQGFEVGVHDLHHDGKLYRTRRAFSMKAARINHYVREWGAAGFRSAFMLHNLEWIAELEVQYDMSTFDTDPFEPQPHGVGTIFPFWVPRPVDANCALPDGLSADNPASRPQVVANGRRNGYVELPYTLPQDSTLFLLLGESSPDIWLQKLDWIAKHGGMALVNVHPDYIDFHGRTPSRTTYPVDLYRRLLEYARSRYGDSFWHPLPTELAAYVEKNTPHISRRPRRVCMVTYSYFMSDARVTRYAEALAGRGDQVDVLALKASAQEPSRQIFGNINLIRMQARPGKREKSKLSFLLPVLRFLASSAFWIARRHARCSYDVLHIHNVPDFLVFAAAYPKLKGAKVILDIHGIVPEFYGSKFGARPDSAVVRMLKCMEHISAGVADHVIISNHLWRDKYAARTGSDGKCSVFINNVDTGIFHLRPKTRADGKTIVIFPGGLQWHQGLDIAIRAFQKVSARIPHAEFHIYGDGNVRDQLVTLSRELGLQEKVIFFKPLPVREVAEIMANADLGVVPKRADSFGNEAYSTKIMEFMALGVPVVVSSTKIDRYYFNDSVVRFFESGNADALADGMLEVLLNANLRQQLVKNALAYVESNSWESRKQAYLDMVDHLIGAEGRGRGDSFRQFESKASGIDALVGS